MNRTFVVTKTSARNVVKLSALAFALGIEGMAKNFVPDSDYVLYHTALLPPRTTDRIFFTAPETPGDYDFICSFPGHAPVMKGIMHVVRE